MANTERVSLYLTEGERLVLRLAARRLAASENYVLKLMIRHYFDLPLTEVQETELLIAFPALTAG
jgi:hypothetical protein